MEILRIQDLNFRYPNNQTNSINNVSLTVNKGEFILICGETGCGKTTLLKLLKKEVAPHGDKSGEIYYNNINQNDLKSEVSASDIGFVMQNPDNQIVTDKVWHELAFGLENLGVSAQVIRRRVGEMSSYFGIHEWYRKKTDELSGGQKQILNLAAIMVMQPKVLILDEPTSQLDPIAASDFINTLKKLNNELDLTIIIVEHRLEEVFPIADKVIVMEKGGILLNSSPRNIGEKLKAIKKDHKMLEGLPTAVKIHNRLGVRDFCPLTVKEGRTYLSKHFKNEKSKYNIIKKENNQEVVVEFKDVWFRYEKNLPDILRGLNIKIKKGEIFCILGGNGTGKTTTLNVLAGLCKAYRGNIYINGKKIKDYKLNELYIQNIALLPQNPQLLFFKDTVEDDLMINIKHFGYPENEYQDILNNITNKLRLSDLLDKHPYDLSGGEQQKCALAKLLLMKPKILLLDEPTKGLDAESKRILKEILFDLKKEGITIIIVSHDVEFAAENVDRCAMFFDGGIISQDIPEIFFSENNFYTTAANKISRHMYEGTVTCDSVVQMCKENGVANE